jgi:hypothetical protein
MAFEDDMRPGWRGWCSRFAISLALFQTIADFWGAKRIARRAALVGVLFAAMHVLGGVSVIANWRKLGRSMDPITLQYLVLGVGQSVLAALAILVLAWRINTGRGYICALLLTFWFVGVQLENLIIGMPLSAMTIVYAGMVLLLIDGVRASLAGSRLARLPSDSDRIRAFE